MPEGVLPLAPLGSVPVTVTGKLRLVPVLGSGLTVLVGGVVSISHEVESEPVPAMPSVLDAGGVDGQGVVALGLVQAARPLIG